MNPWRVSEKMASSAFAELHHLHDPVDHVEHLLQVQLDQQGRRLHDLGLAVHAHRNRKYHDHGLISLAGK
jgi:hypothetical protein